jgi:hypothetical protein
MFEKLSRGEVFEAVDMLIDTMGVKETVPFSAFKGYLKKKDKQGCIEKIAILLDLPVCINISVASKDYRQENAKKFTSSSMAQTDEKHHGKESIIAQVMIPQYLPMWGTPGLYGYEIEVLVSENWMERPDTFVTIMAHELSHILLAAIRSPYKDSEFHTDLVPILFGFGEFVRRGRKISYVTTSGNESTTHTITYGYLSDEIFGQAYTRIKEFLGNARHKKRRLEKMTARAEHILNETVRQTVILEDCFAKISTSQPRKMKTEHARRLVELHGQDFEGELNACFAGAKRKLEDTTTFIQGLGRYTKQAVEELDVKTKLLDGLSKELESKTETIVKDSRIMKKYIKKQVLAH